MHARNSQRGRERPLTSLIFPAYNAGAFIARTWQAVEEFLRRTQEPWEAVFVCDGCTDDTPDQLEAWAKPLGDRVRVLSYRPNRGKGYAVRHGLLEARGQWRIFTDVDLAYGFEDVERIARALRGGADVAIASRVHPDSRLTLPPGVEGYAYRRRLQSQVFSRLVRLLLPLTQGDTQAGLKGLTRSAAERIVPTLRCNGFGFDCELLTSCLVHGVGVTEVPVSVRYENSASTTTPRTMLRMVRELWAIRRRFAGARHQPLPPPKHDDMDWAIRDAG